MAAARNYYFTRDLTADEASLLAVGKRHGNTYTDPRIEDGYFWELSDTNGPEYANAQNRGIVTLADDDDHVRYWTKGRRGKKASHTANSNREENDFKSENSLSELSAQKPSHCSSSSHTTRASAPSERRDKKLRMRVEAANLRATAAKERATAAEERATAAEERATAAEERATAAEERAQATELEIAAMDEDEKEEVPKVPKVTQKVRKRVKQEQDMESMDDMYGLNSVA
ncbi:hypothetical protein J3E72DRAFT_267432 [Bipolaris maydis]|nr:hypothetical protein BM1_00046 [Bipolaris maydis]KAJ6192030.1 hypothetical protein J3E72DRAFT_273841 [Bipolaris maydis]KAJ6200006.1 hypothetical protein J3E72DRAFT_267432 [Bipolaris maydis]